MLLGIVLWHPFQPVIAHGVLEMTAIDVGQGESILVTLPDGKLVLVDGGGIASFGRTTASRLDIGEDVVSPYLWSRHIRRIDVVALSHAHQDHLGGLAAILNNFEVGELWTGATPAGPVWDPLAAVARARGVKIVPMRRGDPFVFGGAHLHVIAPSVEYEPGPTPRNNDSLAISVKFGQRTFLLTGDMERQVEAELIARGLVTHADVLKVAHHGSKTSSTAALIEAASPAFAIISAGFENSYGHPHRDILDRLADHRVCVLRTDQLGLVTIRTNGLRLELETGIWLPREGIVEPVFDR
ncbi:MAG: ComEC/Rec2 family competence protein [Bryobacteraceae bacterium]